MTDKMQDEKAAAAEEILTEADTKAAPDDDERIDLAAREILETYRAAFLELAK